MKAIIRYISMVGLASMMMACSYTDLEPTDKVGDQQIFSSVSTLEQALTGAYSKMSLRTTISVSSVLSDDVYKGGQNGGAGDDSYQWTYSAATGDHNNLWLDYYGVINMANRVIAGADGMKAESAADEATRANCVGSALFLRAYTYFDLLRFFSDFDAPSSLGVPYSQKKVVLEAMGRNSVSECFEGMISDLEKAMPMLRQVNAEDPNYVSQMAVKALLARIYLYQRNYDKASLYASEVLAKKPIVGLDQYADIWNDTNKDEIIFQLKRLPGEETIGTIFFSADNSSAFEPSTELMNCFDVNDVRRDIFIGDGIDRDKVPVKRVNKYKGTPENVGLADQKLLRSSEMMLILAEAKAYTDVAEGSNVLNQLRAARIRGWQSVAYPDKKQLLDEILLERRRELCFEGHRFFDLRRYNLPIFKPMINKTLEVGNIRRVMPIPLSEMQGNAIIANQQNPGY